MNKKNVAFSGNDNTKRKVDHSFSSEVNQHQYKLTFNLALVIKTALGFFNLILCLSKLLPNPKYQKDPSETFITLIMMLDILVSIEINESKISSMKQYTLSLEKTESNLTKCGRN